MSVRDALKQEVPDLRRLADAAREEEVMRGRNRVKKAIFDALTAAGGSGLPMSRLAREGRAYAFGPVQAWKGQFDKIHAETEEIKGAVARLVAEGEILCTPFRNYALYSLASRPDFLVVRQSDGRRVRFHIGTLYCRRSDGAELGVLRAIEKPTENEVNALFVSSEGVDIWKDISWNFHRDYRESQ